MSAVVLKPHERARGRWRRLRPAKLDRSPPSFVRPILPSSVHCHSGGEFSSLFCSTTRPRPTTLRRRRVGRCGSSTAPRGRSSARPSPPSSTSSRPPTRNTRPSADPSSRSTGNQQKQYTYLIQKRQVRMIMKYWYSCAPERKSLGSPLKKHEMRRGVALGSLKEGSLDHIGSVASAFTVKIGSIFSLPFRKAHTHADLFGPPSSSATPLPRCSFFLYPPLPYQSCRKEDRIELAM